MKHILIAVLLLLPWSALAQDGPLPALYRVTGVATNDVLNIRKTPQANADIIGSLSPNQAGVEVVTLSNDLKWGQVNSDESAGWVSMRYLARDPGQDWGNMPWPLDCYGTEPFWDLFTDGENELVLKHMDKGTTRFQISMTTGVVGRSDRFWIRGENGHGEALLTVRREECHDDMTDRTYGLGLDVLIDQKDGSYALSGCCSIIPR